MRDFFLLLRFIRLRYYLCCFSPAWFCNRLFRFFPKKLCRQFPCLIQYFRNQQRQYRNSSHNNTSKTFRLAAEYINRFSDAVCDIFLFYLLYLCFGNAADDCPVNFPVPTHTHFVIGLYLFCFRVVFPIFLVARYNPLLSNT